MGIMMNSYQFLSTRTDIRMEPPVRYRSDHGQRIFYRMAHGLVLGRMRRIESLRHQPRKHSRMDMYVLQPAPPPPPLGSAGEWHTRAMRSLSCIEIDQSTGRD